MELSGNGRERMVATTTVTIPKEGPITTTSVIETHPGPNQSDQEQDLVTPSTQRIRRVRIADNGEMEIFPTAPPQSNSSIFKVCFMLILARFSNFPRFIGVS